MELKPGYKQTEVGVLPEDWEVKRLGQIGKVVRGGSPRPAGDPKFFDGDFIPWLTVAALTNIPDHQLEVRHTETRLTEEGSKQSRTLQRGTVIIANSGATLGVAKVSAIECCANDGIAAIIDQHVGGKAFACHCINAQTQRLREVVATGNGQPNLNTGLIKDIAIPWPPQAEQAAIAECISDLDELLRCLEEAIIKKQSLKQGAMQELLTGKRRLPVFEGEWEEVELGDIAAIRNAKTVASSMPAETQCVELECIEQGSGRLLMTNHPTGQTTKYTFKEGDVLFGRLRAYLRKFWLASFDGVCSTEIWPLIARDERLSAGFLHLLVQTNDFIDAACVSYGTHMPRSDWAVLRKFQVKLPPRPEQDAIATVIADIDAELSDLVQRSQKASQLKQGMMQQLLTGKIRLI